MSDKPVRIQRKRVKGWRMPPNTKSVTRPGKWGNPWVIGDTARLLNDEVIVVETNEDAVRLFRHDLESMPPDQLEELLAPLRGFNLACFCGEGKACHADVLLELANA